MDHRTLGRTDLSVSALTLGTMTFGSQNTPEDAFAIMDAAADAGITMFDNAEMYPVPPSEETKFRCEEIMGDWFASRKAHGKVMIATKVAGRSQMGWMREDGHKPKLVAADINEAVEGSLRRLKTDVIDLYQIHWPDRVVPQFGSNPTVFNEPEPAADETPIEETLEALGKLVDAGKVRHIGLSNESTWGVMKYLHAAETKGLPRIASIQNAYSLLNRTFEVNLAEACLREDVSLLCYSALAQGYLTGKYRNGALPEGARKTLYNRLQRYEGPGAEEVNDMYLDLAAAHGLDPTQMAIAFAMSRPFMTSVIIGATKVSQFETLLAATDLTLSEEVVTAIDTLHRSRGNVAP